MMKPTKVYLSFVGFFFNLLIIAKNAFGMVGEIVPEAFFFCPITKARSGVCILTAAGLFVEECRNSHSFSLNFETVYTSEPQYSV